MRQKIKIIPIDEFEANDGVVSYSNQGLTVKIKRIRNRGLLDKI